jgi:hypothetical protein
MKIEQRLGVHHRREHGALTPIPGSPFAAGSFPNSVTTTAPAKRCKRDDEDRDRDERGDMTSNATVAGEMSMSGAKIAGEMMTSNAKAVVEMMTSTRATDSTGSMIAATSARRASRSMTMTRRTRGSASAISTPA